MGRLLEIFSVQYLSFMMVLIIYFFVGSGFYFTSWTSVEVDKYGSVISQQETQEVEVHIEDVPEPIEDKQLDPLPDTESPKSLSSDLNDEREKSDVNYSKHTESVEESVKARERAYFEQAKLDRERVKKQLGEANEYKKIEKPDFNDNNGTSGKAFSGRTMADFDLTSPRRYSRTGGLKIPGYTGLKGGVIVVKVEVDEVGYVQKAEIETSRTTISDASAQQNALRYAKNERFKRDENAPKRQSGYFIYTFVSQ